MTVASPYRTPKGGAKCWEIVAQISLKYPTIYPNSILYGEYLPEQMHLIEYVVKGWNGYDRTCLDTGLSYEPLGGPHVNLPRTVDLPP